MRQAVHEFSSEISWSGCRTECSTGVGIGNRAHMQHENKKENRSPKRKLSPPREQYSFPLFSHPFFTSHIASS